MSHKLLTLTVRGLNSSRKRRQVFRWLHLQRSDIIFLQETYSSTETIKRWEAEWGGKVVASHGTTHSKGVMVMFKPKLNVIINKTLADNNGRYILAETSIDETNIVFVNIYAPNDPSQQILFLRDLSSSVLSAYANENDEENLLTSRFAQPSAKLQTAYSEDEKAELERVKIKLSDFQTEKTRGAIIRSRARWYEHGEKNSKYFLNLEKLTTGENIYHL